ncbi:MAG TPA: SpoIIE family protein phosphatase [Bacteroidales bacterium]|nr:SpoIIE family protein phosphatase [Bacteroidales bacterium]
MDYSNHQNLDLVSLVQSQKMEDHLASLQYARMIQRALLPDPEMLKGLFKDHFVLFLPRDIVSGDFYYVFSRNQYICVAAGDCTGHGVPGALLSILGISFLNDILQLRSDPKANRILNLMREKVMKALHQTGARTEAKDSIDIGLCIIDPTEGKLQFSGANRPLIRVREGSLSEFKPDKMTIGVAPVREQPFTNQILDILPGDTYYLYSDGFSDQFGEETDKKFKQKQLKNLIESISDLSMTRQKAFLKETFFQWKGNCQQIDDVLIFGFKI